jgi:hypothetical protein
MGRRSIAEKYGKKVNTEVDAVVDAEVVPTVSEEAEEKVSKLQAKKKDAVVKVDSKGLAKVSKQEVMAANPDFEGLGGGGGFFVKKSGDKFMIVHPDLPEPILEPTLKCVLLGRRVCYTAGGEGVLIKSYDKVTTVDGKDFQEEAAKYPDSIRFRSELTIGLADFDEPVQLLTSGTGFYNMNKYAEFLLDPTKEKGGEAKSFKLNEVVTEIYLKVDTDKKGTYI